MGSEMCIRDSLRSKQTAASGISDDLKRYLEAFKAEIITSFRQEFDRVNNNLATLNDKVQKVEAESIN